MLIFDIEANGLLVDVTKVHCMTIYDTHTHEYEHYSVDSEHHPPIIKGVERLSEALRKGKCICGHNVINYDIPTLRKVFHIHWREDYEKQVLDTLIMARLIYSNLNVIDLGYVKGGRLPSNLYKSQSLRAWGYRLGVLKGELEGDEDSVWMKYSPEMSEYNIQDVRVTVKLYETLRKQNYASCALKLEHEVAWLVAQMEQNGFGFDLFKAYKLKGELNEMYDEVNFALCNNAPPIPDKVFVPKRDNKTKGYVKGVPIQRYKEFNPSSRKQIEWVIRKHFNYSPADIDLYAVPDNEEADPNKLDSYRLKIDEDTLTFITEDEANASEELRVFVGLVLKSLLIGKRLGQISTGTHAWIKEYNGQTGCIHGHVITNGAVSGRATHSSPNIAQVPAVGAVYGQQCRELFRPKHKDWYEVGVDASGLELRCLAHYMYSYDHGEYAHEILNGDIHTKNQMNAGLPTRSNAKTFIYGFLYGAGDAKIGKIIGGTAEQGRAIKRKFLQATPAIKNLRDAIRNSLVETKQGQVIRWKRHYLTGLDGRHLHVRSVHSALNLLLQSAGAIICKKWLVETKRRLKERGLREGWDKDYAFMAWIHDEFQMGVRTKEIGEIVIEEAQLAMRDTQRYFDFKVQLDTEGKLGRDWAECH